MKLVLECHWICWESDRLPLSQRFDTVSEHPFSFSLDIVPEGLNCFDCHRIPGLIATSNPLRQSLEAFFEFSSNTSA
jgi:hypothetical protein